MRFKFLFSFLFLFIFFFTAAAQEDSVRHWKFGGTSNFTFAQVGLKNWIGGGQSSMSINSLQTLFLTQEREKFKWSNNLEWGYGTIRQGDLASNFIKSDDRFIFLSKGSRNMVDKWMLTGLLDVRTQMVAGYDFKRDAEGVLIKDMISDFMAPGFVITSLGWEYRESENIFFVLSPITSKVTVVLHDRFAQEGRFGVVPGRNIRSEIGAFVNARYKKQLFENVTLDTRINLFGNYQNFKSIDVNSEILLLMKINKYLTTTFSVHIIYDDDIDILRADGSQGPDIQVKQVLNVGLMYKFGDN
jgi:hypothetical protein